jgi:hypothetical protein
MVFGIRKLVPNTLLCLPLLVHELKGSDVYFSTLSSIYIWEVARWAHFTKSSLCDDMVLSAGLEGIAELPIVIGVTSETVDIFLKLPRIPAVVTLEPKLLVVGLKDRWVLAPVSAPSIP